jgi:DNA-binding beta-propeller fold protein YncE/cytochrome c peroxidase
MVCVSAAAAIVAGGCESGTKSTVNAIEVGATTQALTRVPQPANSYSLFEALQVRPLALSAKGNTLFAVNTPDNRLEIFTVNGTKKTPKSAGSVTVGMEPVAVAVRNDHEVWVVNQLSDSVSIVRIGDDGFAQVTRTLNVGDEPRDIVFAGPNNAFAFITTAHRGQNTGDDPDLFNPQAGRADVWVFDTANLGTSAGGNRLTKLTFFADTPRALAVSADKTRVYAAPYFSGNQTTIASKEVVATTYASSVDPNNPFFFYQFGMRQPLTSRVVKYKPGPDGTSHWFDDLGTNFDSGVRVTLPDLDVFTIDATQNPPVAIPAQTFAHAGTTLFNMAVNPANGKVYVANTDAHNDVRFEGHNESLGFTTVRGNIVDSRITVIDPATGNMVYDNLNPHIVNGAGDASLSRAFPQGMAVTADGSKLYVVAQGSGKLAVYDTASLEAGSATPTSQNQVLLSAGGPTGIVLDEGGGAGFVLTRFDNGISLVDLGSRREIGHVKMFNPEPAKVTDGRRFLYDAAYTSATGTQACASCHVGGDFDGLAWDLGNPGGIPLPITQNGDVNALFTAPPALLSQLVPASADLFKAYLQLKGPMTTQSLRGLDNHGAMHWRGDRNGAIKQDGTPFLDVNNNPVVSAQPNSGIFDEFQAFFSFNVAFAGLVGRDQQLSSDEMSKFTNFALQIMYPPNPIRQLDNSLTPTETAGRAVYFQTTSSGAELPVDRLHNCNGCHTLDPSGNAGSTDHPGFFGTKGRISFENLPQAFKVAHLRNLYQKVGMFASSPDSNRTFTPSPQLNPPLAAVRGFGYQPDGAVGSVEHHMTGVVFVRSTNTSAPAGANPGGLPTFQLDANGNPLPIPDPAGFTVRRQVGSFLMAYDSNFKPIVGQQVTIDVNSGADADARVALLIARAEAQECDLVAKACLNESTHGFVYENGTFRPDSSAAASLTLAQLKTALASDAEDNPLDTVTFTCVPPGSGYRIGIDRDADGIADGDEH